MGALGGLREAWGVLALGSPEKWGPLPDSLKYWKGQGTS